MRATSETLFIGFLVDRVCGWFSCVIMWGLFEFFRRYIFLLTFDAVISIISDFYTRIHSLRWFCLTFACKYLIGEFFHYRWKCYHIDSSATDKIKRNPHESSPINASLTVETTAAWFVDISLFFIGKEVWQEGELIGRIATKIPVCDRSAMSCLIWRKYRDKKCYHFDGIYWSSCVD